MDSSENQLRMLSFSVLLVTSNSHLLSWVGLSLEFNKFALTRILHFSFGGDRFMVRAELR